MSYYAEIFQTNTVMTSQAGDTHTMLLFLQNQEYYLTKNQTNVASSSWFENVAFWWYNVMGRNVWHCVNVSKPKDERGYLCWSWIASCRLQSMKSMQLFKKNCCQLCHVDILFLLKQSYLHYLKVNVCPLFFFPPIIDCIISQGFYPAVLWLSTQPRLFASNVARAGRFFCKPCFHIKFITKGEEKTELFTPFLFFFNGHHVSDWIWWKGGSADSELCRKRSIIQMWY